MEIIQTNSAVYKDQIIALYVEAFSIGKSQQYIDLKELDVYIDLILKDGYVLFSKNNEDITGAILICPLILDKTLPSEISENYDIEKCLYVAEMMVAEKVRGFGIGKELLTEFFKTVDKLRFTDVFIRVWNENIPALNLYHKIGFEPVATIEQTKKKTDGIGNFVMEKIYLHKKLN